MNSKDDRLALVAVHGLRGRELAAVARRDEPVEVALHDGRLHFVVGGDQALGHRRLFGRPLGDVGADAERALHGAEHAVGQRCGAAG